MQQSAKQTAPWPKTLILLAIAGCLLHSALVFSTRIPSSGSNVIDEKTSFIEYLGSSIHYSDTKLAEQSALFDYEPVFLPTKWNHKVTPDFSEAPDKPVNVFNPYPAEPLLNRDNPAESVNINAGLKPGIRESGNPVTALQDIDFPPLSKGFGNRKENEEPSTASVTLRAENLDNGKIIYGEHISGPTVARINSELWNAESFLAVVDSSGYTLSIPTGGIHSNEPERERLDIFTQAVTELKLPKGYYRITFRP